MMHMGYWFIQTSKFNVENWDSMLIFQIELLDRIQKQEVNGYIIGAMIKLLKSFSLFILSWHRLDFEMLKLKEYVGWHAFVDNIR